MKQARRNHRTLVTAQIIGIGQKVCLIYQVKIKKIFFVFNITEQQRWEFKKLPKLHINWKTTTR